MELYAKIKRFADAFGVQSKEEGGDVWIRVPFFQTMSSGWRFKWVYVKSMRGAAIHIENYCDHYPGAK